MIINRSIGVLGGGQLGKMLAQAGSRWDLDLSFLDNGTDFPTAGVTNQFILGNFTNDDDVLRFGQDLDILTIEIENVSTTALKLLEKDGKKIYPQPTVIETIKDKGLQKKFYQERQLPTSQFNLHESALEISSTVREGLISYPFVQKARTEGYDGRGVHIVRSEEDLLGLLDVPSVIEDLVDIDKELAVIVARNPRGDIEVFPPVEMTFHPTANLVEELISPARVSLEISTTAIKLAEQVIQSFDMVGLLAIELFLTADGTLLINEVAPRPHNSGHQTIEGNVTSQYEQLLRAILDMPLGSTALRSPSVMINILGEPDHRGAAKYQGLDEVLAMDNVHVHIYGKKETKPFRKMGHVTILDASIDQALAKAKRVKDILKVVS